MKTGIILFLLCLLSFIQLTAQDIHFSQFTASPLFVNPALCGFFNDQIRVGLNYRNQGATISIPYKTYAATIDGVVQPGFLHNDWFGIGGILYNDNAGDGRLQKTSVMATVAFHKGFNRFNTLKGALGFSIGVVNRSVDFSKLVFGSQWDGVQFDTSLSANEHYTTGSFYYLDLNVGMLVSYELNRSSIISGGVSLNHVNKPGETFYSQSTILEWKWIAHMNGSFRVNEQLFLESGFMWIYMNGLSEMMFGANLHCGEADLRFCSGLWYRVSRDIIPMIGLDYHRYSLLFSYDITVSELRNASKFQGGFELSIQKTFSVSNKNNSCENVRFQ
jgi:type IX secretion system PorP/SprF family membrane protein